MTEPLSGFAIFQPPPAAAKREAGHRPGLHISLEVAGSVSNLVALGSSALCAV